MISIYISSNVAIAVLISLAIVEKRQKKREFLTKVSRYTYLVWYVNHTLVKRSGHWALVLNVPLRGSKLRVASRREVLGIGHWH
ncbi:MULTISPECIES: hypothetical protein [unclassified Nostoc]|uniref:hypothetical protein n=1 Tax=unclassified Nostoc TaxID=2593658 RepID=UPI00262140F9|nr:hypothetical protein [Nostoc sp. S13]MDF5738356.1 hypothetical protein [Nostoc sp. S13]